MMRLAVSYMALLASMVVPLERSAVHSESWAKVAHTGTIDWCTDVDALARYGSTVTYHVKSCDAHASELDRSFDYRVDCSQDFSKDITIERRGDATEPWKSWPGTPVKTSGGQSAKAVCNK
jgi:hypothetical protein